MFRSATGQAPAGIPEPGSGLPPQETGAGAPGFLRGQEAGLRRTSTSCEKLRAGAPLTRFPDPGWPKLPLWPGAPPLSGANIPARTENQTPAQRDRPRRAWRVRRSQSSTWIVNATANPSVTMIPTSLPPCSNASGIIVLASMVRIAPAAKVRTKATTSGEEFWKRP